MIVILEGPDNAGKSTLGNKLAIDLHLDLIHPGGPPKNLVEVIERCQEQSTVFSHSTTVDFIFDRVTCISDQIYRGRTDLYKLFDFYQNDLRSAKNIIIIYCRPSDDRLRNFDDHVQKDHEDEAIVQHAIDNVDRIINEYDSIMDYLMSDKHVCIIKYDFERDTHEASYHAILEMLKNKRNCK